MAAELSFTKRAAAELSRCFNGLNMNKNSSSTKKSTNLNKTSSTFLSISNHKKEEDKLDEFNNSNNKLSNELNQNLNKIENKNDKLNLNGNNFFTLTNSVRSIGNAYEQNILAAKSALRSPFKSPLKQNSNISSKTNSTFLINNNFDNKTPNSINSCLSLPSTPRKQAPIAPPKTNRARVRNYLLTLRNLKAKNLNELWQDKKFLRLFFSFFNAKEKCELAQVNSTWKNILYEDQNTWKQLTPVIYFNKLRENNSNLNASKNLIESIDKRKFETICLFSANDNDIIDFCMKTSFLSITHNIIYCKLHNCCLSDKGLEILLTTINQNLSSLELNTCNDLNDASLWTGLVKNLKKLIIVDCINIADETLATIAQLLPYLKELTIQAYHITDTGFSFFSLSDTKLQIECLNLLSCWEISNQSILYIIQNMPNLTKVSLSGCSKISDDAIELMAAQLNNLSYLDLSWCTRITDTSLEFLACSLCEKLKVLILDRCIHITDYGLSFIFAMDNIELLSLRWCSQIRDFGIQTLSNLQKLKSLSLAGCSLITQKGFKSLTRLPQLKELELTNCSQITPKLIDELRKEMIDCEIIAN